MSVHNKEQKLKERPTFVGLFISEHGVSMRLEFRLFADSAAHSRIPRILPEFESLTQWLEEPLSRASFLGSVWAAKAESRVYTGYHGDHEHVSPGRLVCFGLSLRSRFWARTWVLLPASWAAP